MYTRQALQHACRVDICKQGDGFVLRSLLEPAEQSSLNYFASAWCAVENMLLAAAAEGLGTAFHIPVSDEAEMIKKIVGAPEDYEFTCLLTIGYPAENAFLPKQKEIDIEDRIHENIW